MVDKAILNAFASLFKGRTDAYGSVEGRCNKDAVTLEHYERHLDGKESLGIYPLLDNGNCNFFAFDIDQPDFEKAKAIRAEMANLFLPVYIFKSKSKGYHIYGFGIVPIRAEHIRRIMAGVLTKLGIPKTEIFPKQDKIDPKTPYGNYINLPCFGLNSRMPLTGKGEEVDVKTALSLIKRIDYPELQAALKLFPATESTMTPKPVAKETQAKQKKKGAPPHCIESVLKGVSEGGRDEAAFALARHYFDQGFIAEEVLGLLENWDSRNKPPIADRGHLEIKVRSAEKGYAFGCKSIKENANLSHLCVGEENCRWFQKAAEAKKAKGLLKELSLFEQPSVLWEEVYKCGKAGFIGYNRETQEYLVQEQIDCEGFSVMPITGADLLEGCVTLPDGVEDGGDAVDIVDALKRHLHAYIDVPAHIEEFAAWYIMMSWIYDRLTTVSYFRFRGDTGTGKSRCLDVVGRLCYKPMQMSGAVTPAPIYRMIRRWRGTLVMDEADFDDTSEKAEVVTVLNCGFEKGRPIIRCSKDDPDDLQVLPCFGPKVITTRQAFADKALESRCLTHITEETDRSDIPSLLGDTFFEAERGLRRKLLHWRLRIWHKIEQSAVDHLDLGMIEPRLKQTGLPYAVAFKDLPEVLEKYKQFLKEYNKTLIAERSDSWDGSVVEAIFKMFKQHGIGNVAVSTVAEALSTEEKKITTHRISGRLKSLNIVTERRRGTQGQLYYLVWDNKIMRKLLRRYISDKDEFNSMFEEAPIDMEF